MALASKIRELAARGQYGRSCKPSGFYMTDGYCSYCHSWASGLMTFPEWSRACVVLSRYHRFLAYCREVAPLWQSVRQIHFADNSVEDVQFSPVLNCERRVMIEAPHGDACY